MRGCVAWSAEDDSAFRRMWAEGKDLDQIASALNRTYAATQFRRRHLGLLPRSSWRGGIGQGPGRKITVWTEERTAILRRDYPIGVPVGEIADAINATPGPQVSGDRVSRHASAIGLKRLDITLNGISSRMRMGNAAGCIVHRARWTPERNALLRDLYTKPILMPEMLEQLNTLPGAPIIAKQVWIRAKVLGISRAPEALALSRLRPNNRVGSPTNAVPRPAVRPTSTAVPEIASVPAPAGSPTNAHVRSTVRSAPLTVLELASVPAPARPADVSPRRSDVHLPRFTRDGLPSIACRLASSEPVPGEAEPIAWADALRWAAFNRIPMDGSGDDILARINAARAPMPPWRIIDKVKAEPDLPPPWEFDPAAGSVASEGGGRGHADA